VASSLLQYKPVHSTELLLYHWSWVHPMLSSDHVWLSGLIGCRLDFLDLCWAI